jgi:acyl dehydratase
VAVNRDYLGRTFVAPVYEVAAVKLREFARAVGASHPACFDAERAQGLGYPSIVAAPTFAVVIAQLAEAAYVDDPGAGIDFERVVHADQRFAHARPIVAGDFIGAAVEVESIVERGGLALVTTRTDLTDAAVRHTPVATVWSTLAVRGEEP